MSSTLIKEPPGAAPTKGSRPPDERVVTSQELLGGGRRIWIEHSSRRYLLQVTRSGKLILTR